MVIIFLPEQLHKLVPFGTGPVLMSHSCQNMLQSNYEHELALAFAVGMNSSSLFMRLI
jgi:hypothetical protein